MIHVLLPLLLAAIRVPAPTILPVDGTYEDVVTVTVANVASGESTYCALNARPRRSEAQKYRVPFNIEALGTTSVSCQSFTLDGRAPSRVVSRTYTITPGGAGGATATMTVSGRNILDAYGNVFIPRGVEQILSPTYATPEYHATINPAGGTLEHLVYQIWKSGANSVRFLLRTDAEISLSTVDALVGRAVNYGLVVYLSNSESGNPGHLAWWGRADVKAMIEKYKASIIIDGLQEPEGAPTVAAWVQLAKDHITYIRGQGYEQPITIMGPTYGRDLPSVLTYGAEIVGHDPLHRVILGWQAYWGNSGWYLNDYGGDAGLTNPTSVANGVTVAATKNFPIQVGFDFHADYNDPMDYAGGMTAARQYGVGWMWWTFWLPSNTTNSILMTTNTVSGLKGGDLANLNPAFGAEILTSHAGSLQWAAKAHSDRDGWQPWTEWAPGYGWAASCSAEPEPTTNVVYVCDCQSGADANCVAGSDTNLGTKTQPYQTWTKLAEAWRGLPAGGTVAICKGGSVLGSHLWIDKWQSPNCTAAQPCTLREYTPPWASGDERRPTVLSRGSDETLITLYGTAAAPRGHYRFLNLRFYREDHGTSLASKGAQAFRGMDKIEDVEVCNCDFDGLGGAFYVYSTTNPCGTVGWKIRGNRIANICNQGMLFSAKDSDVDSNLFDNVGHSACGGYDLNSPSGGTSHSLYMDGRQCPNTNVRVINNEVRRNSYFGGGSIGSAFVFSSGADGLLYENNLIDMTPVHPDRQGGAIFGGNEGSGLWPGPVTNITVRRNRILAGRGRQIGISQAPSLLVEDNVITVSAPDSYYYRDIMGFPHTGGGTGSTVATVRNNTIYFSGAGDSLQDAVWMAYSTAGSGNNITGNSITFAGGGGACFRVDDYNLVPYMDRNQCSGPNAYVRVGTTGHSLAGWRALSGKDANSITPAATGLFVSPPTDLTPASGSPLINAADTTANCTVQGAIQLCPSMIAIDSPVWSATSTAKPRTDNAPDIGAMER